MIRPTEILFLKWLFSSDVNRTESSVENDVKSLIYKELSTSLALSWRALARISHYWLVWSTESFRARSTQENQRNEHDCDHERLRIRQRTGSYPARLGADVRAPVERTDHRCGAELWARDPRTWGGDLRHRSEGSGEAWAVRHGCSGIRRCASRLHPGQLCNLDRLQEQRFSRAQAAQWTALALMACTSHNLNHEG